jgi:hypothetical protein
LHKCVILLSSAFDSVQRCDDVRQSARPRASAGSQDTKLVVGLRVQAIGQVTSVIAKDCNILRSFQWQSIVDVLQKDDASSSKFPDELLVVAANIDARLAIVSEVVQI